MSEIIYNQAIPSLKFLGKCGFTRPNISPEGYQKENLFEATVSKIIERHLQYSGYLGGFPLPSKDARETRAECVAVRHLNHYNTAVDYLLFT